jgi:predicted glycosyltransferase
VLTINADTTVTATFNQPPMVMMGLVPYATIQAAYAAAPAETTLKVRDQLFNADLLFDGAVNLIFLGGYNTTWDEPAAGNTTVNGSVTVSGASGSVTVNNLIIE